MSGGGVFQADRTPRAKTLRQKYVANMARAEWPRQRVAGDGVKDVAWERDDRQVTPVGHFADFGFYSEMESLWGLCAEK